MVKIQKKCDTHNCSLVQMFLLGSRLWWSQCRTTCADLNVLFSWIVTADIVISDTVSFTYLIPLSQDHCSTNTCISQFHVTPLEPPSFKMLFVLFYHVVALEAAAFTQTLHNLHKSNLAVKTNNLGVINKYIFPPLVWQNTVFAAYLNLRPIMFPAES